MSWGLLLIAGAATYLCASFAMAHGFSTAAVACGFIVIACLLLVLCAAVFDAFDIDRGP